jgi:cytochrome c oxidase subunit 2
MTQPATPALHPHDDSEDRIERIERRWAAMAVGIVALLVVIAVFAGLHQATMPQSRVETADPRTLHLAGEFVESNLGSAVEPDGSVTVRAIGQQYSFTPQCILVPAGKPVTLRVTSADVVHGFLITATNVNTMLVPGYISVIATRFDTPGERHMPCHEFCGSGHEGMWGRIKVIDQATFEQMAANRRRLDCVE